MRQEWRDERQRPDLMQRRFPRGFTQYAFGGRHDKPAHLGLGFIYLTVTSTDDATARPAVDRREDELPGAAPSTLFITQRRGWPYTSPAFGDRCRPIGVQPSMGTVGDAYEYELIDRKTFKTRARKPV